MANTSTSSTDTKTTRTPGTKRRKRWPFVVGGVVVFLALLLFLAPVIAGGVAPGIVEKSLKGKFPGEVRVQSASLGWFGDQTIGPVVLRDTSGGTVAQVTIRSERSLMGLIRAGMAGGKSDVGTVHVSGLATIVRGADGVTNLERALGLDKPTPTSSGPSAPSTGPSTPAKPAQLPAGLKANVLIDSLTATYVDESVQPAQRASVDDLKGSIAVAVGGAIKAKLDGQASSGAAGTSTPGTIAISADVSSWSSADGTLTPDKAAVDASVKLASLPTGILDAAAGTQIRAALKTDRTLADALGPTLNLDVTARGTPGDVLATLTLAMERVNSSGQVRYATANGTPGVSLAQPMTLSIKGSAIEALAPAIRSALAAQQDVTLAALPDVVVTIDTLSAKLPSGGAMDLRGAAINGTIVTSAVGGRVALQAGEAPRAFEVQALNARINSADVAQGAKLTGGMKAAIDSQPAGDIAFDVALAGLLDASGAPRKGMPSQINGIVGVHGVATALAQPFVNKLGLDLRRDIGPTLDVDLVASAKGDADSTSAIPPTDLDVTAKAEKLDVRAKLALSEQRIVTRPGGINANFSNAGAIAAVFVPKESGWAVAPSGTMRVQVGTLDVPLRDRKPDIAHATIDGRADFKEWTLTGTGPAPASAGQNVGGPAGGPAGGPIGDAPAATGTPITVIARSIGVGIKSRPGGVPQLGMAAIMEHEGKPFYANATFDIADLFKANAAPGESPINMDPATLRPVGKLELQQIPLAIATALMPPPEAGAMDARKLMTDALGSTASMTIETSATAASAGAAPGPLGVKLNVQAPRATLNANADLATSTFTLRTLEAQTSIDPALVDTLLASAKTATPATGASATTPSASKPGLMDRARLAGPAAVSIALDPNKPLSVPLGAGFKPDLARATPIGITANVGRLIVTGLQTSDEKGNAKPMGDVGVDRLAITASVSPGALLAEGAAAAAPVEASVNGVILGGQQQQLGTLAATLRTEVTRGVPTAPVQLEGSVQNVAASVLEKVLPPETIAPGMLAGAIGETLGVGFRGTIQPPPKDAAGKPDYANAPIDLDVTLSGDHLAMREPLKLQVRADRVALAAPATITLTPDTEWVNRTYLAPPPKQAGGSQPLRSILPGAAADAPAPASALRLTQPISLEVALKSFAISRPPANAAPNTAGPLKPGVFDVALDASVPQVVMANANDQPLSMRGLRVSLARPQNAGNGTIGLKVGGEVVGADGQAAPIQLDGTLANFASDAGVVTMDRATLSLVGNLPNIPTGIVDAFVKKHGIVTELLGPTANVQIRADNISLAPAAPATSGVGGQAAAPSTPSTQAGAPLSLTLEASRASASLKGVVRNGTFEATEPATMSIREITPALGSVVNTALPLIGAIEKLPTDRAASVTISGLRAPLSQDPSGLNAEVSIDPGEARFSTSTVFGGLLKAVKQRAQGEIGTRLNPLTLSIRDGQLAIPKYRVPLGEFTIETEGSVDLVGEKIDIVTWVPFGAVGDDLAGRLRMNTGLGGVVGRVLPIENLTMIPFRTRGTFEKSTTEADRELLLRTLGNAVRPDNVIENIPNILENLPGLGKKKDEQKN